MLDFSAAKQTYLNPSEAAQILGISEISLKRLRLSGQIDFYRPTERVILYTPDMLERFRSRRVARAMAA
jgi:predicted site-specific integrase-resolvase